MPEGQEDRIQEANLLGKIEQLEELIGRLSDDQSRAVEERIPGQIARLRAVTLVLRPRIEATDPLLVNSQTLAQTDAPLTGLKASIAAFLEDGNFEHFNPFLDWTETLIGVLTDWGVGSELPQVDVSEIASRFRRSAGQQLHNLSNDFDRAKDDLATLLQDLEERTGQWGEQKVNLENQIIGLTDTIEKQRDRLDQAIENYQGQFSEAQERRNEEYRQQLSALESQAADTAKEAREDFSQEIKLMQVRAESAVGDLESELSKAQEITSFVGGANTGSYYGDEARSQKVQADLLRLFAVLFGLGAAALAVWAILHASSSDNPTLGTVLTKAIGSLVFAGLAGYVASQSSDHRHREVRARQRELDLLSLPAFIANLPSEQKEEITSEAAKKIFIAEEIAPVKKPPAVLTKDSISLIGQLLDAIRK